MNRSTIMLQQVLLYIIVSFFVGTMTHAQQQQDPLLCRCPAFFETFLGPGLRRNLRLDDEVGINSNLISPRKLSMMKMKKSMNKKKYPYDYNDTYVDDEGYYIVEGIRVLPITDPLCINDDEDGSGRGRRTKQERYVGLASTSAQHGGRNLGKMMMMRNKGSMSSSDGTDCGPRDTSEECLPDIFPCPIPMEPPTDVPTSSPFGLGICTAAKCNDDNVCTTDTCNALNECVNTPIQCGVNEACDRVDGTCKNVDSIRPCVAVIDESDNFSDAEIDARWASFRTSFPDRPFCLLQPYNNISNNYLYMPVNFTTDPRVVFSIVNRDEGDPLLASDWLNACGYSDLQLSGIEFMAFFIDESGSMTRSTVQASLNNFTRDLTAANLTYCSIYNGSEDWISPFNFELGTIGGGGDCEIITMAPSSTPTISVEPSAEPSVSRHPTLLPSSDPSMTPSLLNSVEPSNSHEPSDAPQSPSHSPSISAEPSMAPNFGKTVVCPCEDLYDSYGNPYGTFTGSEVNSAYTITIIYNETGIYDGFPSLSCPLSKGNIDVVKNEYMRYFPTIESGNCAPGGTSTLEHIGRSNRFLYEWTDGTRHDTGIVTFECESTCRLIN